MATKQQPPEPVVEGLEAEVGELRRRRAEAIAQIRSAEERFGELEERRTVLSPRTFSGDKEATAELEQVEDEHDRLARSMRVAKSAVPEFGRMLKEAEGRLAEARERVRREKADQLYRQHAALDAERDEVGKRLAELLNRQADLYHDRVQAVREYDRDEANRMFVSGNGTRDWLELTFARWLLR